MVYGYNDQLIDSVAVRRRRLISALLFGAERTRRMWDEHVVTVLVSVFLAALICAGCVAFSFVKHLLASDPFLRPRTPASSPAVPR